MALYTLDKGHIKYQFAEDYHHYFNRRTGLSMRWGVTKDDDPQYCPYGPEILDLEISTGFCSGNCSWCYKANTPDAGINMSLATFQKILDKFMTDMIVIEFENGNEIKILPNHRVKLTDGREIAASELVGGEDIVFP